MPGLLRFLASLLLIGVLLGNVGCVSARGFGGGWERAASAEPGAPHRRVGSRGEVAKWIFIGTLLTMVVVVDLLILPATYHDPFPCCRAIIVSCH